MLDQAKDVALGRARRIPPASALVIDDDDLARTAPAFQRPPRALALVQGPPAGRALEDDSAVHGLAERLKLRIRVVAHVSSPGAAMAGRALCPPLSIPSLSTPTRRDGGGGQGHRRRSRAALNRRAAPCGPPGASGTGSDLAFLVRHGEQAGRAGCERDETYFPAWLLFEKLAIASLMLVAKGVRTDGSRALDLLRQVICDEFECYGGRVWRRAGDDGGARASRPGCMLQSPLLVTRSRALGDQPCAQERRSWLRIPVAGRPLARRHPVRPPRTYRPRSGSTAARRRAALTARAGLRQR